MTKVLAVLDHRGCCTTAMSGGAAKPRNADHSSASSGAMAGLLLAEAVGDLVRVLPGFRAGLAVGRAEGGEEVLLQSLHLEQVQGGHGAGRADAVRRAPLAAL